MKTRINYTTANGTQGTDHLDYACTAQDYIDGCRINGTDGDYWENDLGAEITASVYEDDADSLWDEPIEVTKAVITAES